MKIIDIYNKIANGEKVPCFKINGEKYGLGEDGYLREFFGDDVKWYIYEHWLNEEVEVLEEVEDKEYEDIKEADEVRQEEYIEFANDYEVKNDLVTNRRLINALIRNQKKIIEVLNDNNKDN